MEFRDLGTKIGRGGIPLSVDGERPDGRYGARISSSLVLSVTRRRRQGGPIFRREGPRVTVARRRPSPRGVGAESTAREGLLATTTVALDVRVAERTPVGGNERANGRGRAIPVGQKILLLKDARAASTSFRGGSLFFGSDYGDSPVSIPVSYAMQVKARGEGPKNGHAGAGLVSKADGVPEVTRFSAAITVLTASLTT